MNKIDNGFVLAAGMGRRLRPYTDDMPKPLVAVNGKALIDHALDKLRAAGVSEAFINMHYMAEKLDAHLHKRYGCGPNLNPLYEEKLMGTGGGFKRALSFIGDKPFYAVSGDSIWTDGPLPALERMSRKWNPAKMDLLLLLQPVSRMSLTTGLGDYDLDSNGQAIRSFNKSGEYMWSSVRIVSPSLFEDTPDTPFSFLELMDKAEENGRLYGLVHDAEWHHISTAEDLERVNAAYDSEKKYA